MISSRDEKIPLKAKIKMELSQIKKPIYLWVRKSQAGKDTSKKYLTNNPDKKIGEYGAGNSTTFEIRTYECNSKKIQSITSYG